MGSIFLAAKVEECPCRLTDLVNVVDHLCKRFQRKPLEPLQVYGEVSIFLDISIGMRRHRLCSQADTPTFISAS